MKKTNKQKILIGMIAAICIIITTVFVLASDTTKILVNITDSGKEQMNETESSIIHRQIVEKESTKDELIIETKIKNNVQTQNEIAILVDDSFSMSYNMGEFNLKNEVKKFITGAFDADISNRKVSLSTNTKKNSMTPTKTTAENYASNLNLDGTTSVLESGLENAIGTFSKGNDIHKSLIIFTDATDEVKEKLQEIKSSNVEITSVLIDLNSNQFVNDDGTNVVGGIIQVNSEGVPETNYNEVYDTLKGTYKNVEIQDKLSDEIVQYFDFELLQNTEDEADPDLLDESDVDLLTEGDTTVGYKVQLDQLEVQKEKKVKYKLKLKENINELIEKNSINAKEIDTNGELSVTYQYNCEKKKNETINSPKIRMTRAQTVTIFAVNEYSKDIKLSGIEFKVVAKDLTTKAEIMNEKITTSMFGHIQIDDITTLDPIEFTITPQNLDEQYEDTDGIQFTLKFNPATGGRVIESEEIYWEDQSSKANTNVFVPIKLKKFDLELNVQDIDDSTIVMKDVEFKLIQPKINSSTEMDVLTGSTDENGVLHFSPTVMNEDGHYDYILSQETVQNAYESMGLAKVRVHFKDGKVKDVKILSNDVVKVADVKEEYVKLIIGNVSTADQRFTLRIFSNDQIEKTPIAGTSYKVLLKVDNDWRSYGPVTTDEEGKVELTLAGNGNIQFKIQETSANEGYIANSTVQTFEVQRKQGKLDEDFIYKPIGIDATINAEDNVVEVKFESSKKSDQNVVRIHAVDTLEQDIYIKDLRVDLTGSDGMTYGARTDENGIANINMPNMPVGSYTYSINFSDVPNGYLQPKSGTITLNYTTDQKIDTMTLLNTNIAPFLSVKPLIEDNGMYKIVGADVFIGLDINTDTNYTFKVKLQASDNKEPIEDARYNIKMVTELESGEIVERIISNRQTDYTGEINTHLLLGKNIYIEVQQTYTNIGHTENGGRGFKLDNTVQEIHLTYDGNNVVLESETPHNAAEGKGMGTTVGEDQAVYLHENDPRTIEDVFLNLHIIKKDEYGAYIQGLGLKIYSDEAMTVNAKGQPKGLVDLKGNCIHDEPICMITDVNGEVDLLRQIKVLGIIEEANEEQTYTFTVKEYDPVTGEDIDESEVKYTIAYRYNKYTSQIDFTNVDIVIGKKKEAERTEFSAYNSVYGYESRIGLTLYPYYGQVGNFTLDLQKYNQHEEKILGAEYNVTVTRPNGNTINYRNKQVSDKVEFGGFFVTKGTIIEIQEVVAPIGYEINEATEVIEITGIEEDGTATYVIHDDGYKTSRIKVEDEGKILLGDGTFRNTLRVGLIDMEENIFKFGLMAEDSTNNKPVKDYSFTIETSMGSENSTDPTNEQGKANTLIGGIYKDKEVVYTISTKKAAPYYKDINPEIQVKIYFDENGNVDSDKTTKQQSDAGYNETWSIVNTNDLNGNAIDIKILVTPYDKLNVEIQTVNKFNGDPIEGITYVIPESVNIEAKGTTSLEVGYVNPGAVKTYTLDAIDEEPQYVNLENQQFQIQYDETTGDIVEKSIVAGDSIEIIGATGKTIKLKVKLEPKAKFNVEIETVDKLTKENLTNIQYSIPESKDIEAVGTTSLEMGYFKMGTTDNIFTIETPNLGPSYEILQNQQFSFDIKDQTGEIENAKVLGNNLALVSASGNTIHLKITLIPKIIINFEIESIDTISEQTVSGIVYSIPESKDMVAKGTGTLEVGYVSINTKDTPENYTINTEDISGAKNEYIIPTAQQIKIGIDEQGNISNYEITTSQLEHVSHEGRTIRLKLKLDPKLPFVIKNKAHTTNVPLQGGTFEITNLENQEVVSETTNANGNAIIYNGTYYNGEDGKDKVVVYLVKQTVAKLKFARVEDFYVAVRFNKERKITQATLSDVNGNVIDNSNNLWVSVNSTTVSEGQLGYNGNDHGIVEIEVSNYPALRLEFENVDRRDNSIKLKEAKYSITSSMNTTGSINTNEQGRDTAYIDGTPVGKYAYYTVHEITPSADYQPIEDFYIKAYFDNNGYVDTVSLVDVASDEGKIININYITVTAIDKAQRTTIEDELTINVKIQSNPRLNVTVKKMSKTGIAINGVRVTLTNKEKGAEEDLSSGNGVTGYEYYANEKNFKLGQVKGETKIKIAKTLTNKKLEFRLTEFNVFTKQENPIGYKKLTEEIVFEVECDNNGRIMPDTINITSGNKYINITNIDSYNFSMTIEFLNEEIEEFGIHLTALDTYDQNKKLENTNGLKVDVSAYIGDSKTGVKDNGIKGTLIPGRDSNSDGEPDIGRGEDYQTFGKVNIRYDWVGSQYDNGLRTIRLTVRNAPDRYYEEANGFDSYYQNITKRIEIRVKFDSEGKIESASAKTGKIDGVWYVDSRYIEVDFSGYALEVKLKFFPTLQLGVNAVDEYTKEHLAGGKYLLATYEYHYNSLTDLQERNKAGYIGDLYYSSKYHYYTYPTYSNTAVTNTNEMPNRYSVGPTEISSNAMRTDKDRATRRIFIYEMQEPSTPMQYQQYEPRYNAGAYYMDNKMLGYIDIYYNELGEIFKEDIHISAGRSIDNNNTENGTYYIKLSENQYDSKHAIAIDIEYKPTTRLKLYAVDEITKAPLSGVRVYPFLNNTITTNRSYIYRTINYYATGSNGLADVTYWGGNLPDANNLYDINIGFIGNTYSEYYNPGKISINVSYDNEGRVKSAVSATHDSFGDPNAQIISYSGNTVEVYILCARKFNIQLNKLDEYERSTELNATFRLTDEKGQQITVKANQVTTLGKITPGITNKYTVTEIAVPTGYLPVDSFELTVVFNSNGTVSSTANTTDYQQIKTANAVSKQTTINHKDIIANIYNKPSFTVQVEVSDEYYSKVKLEGATFNITNDRGDSAQGTCITNDKGYFETYVGPAYPGETVRYTISQSNTVTGYNQNNEVAVLRVEFGENGKIKTYGLEQPTPYNYSVNNTAHINKREVKVFVTNMPRDVKLGITKYDKLTNQKLNGVQFKVKKEIGTSEIKEQSIITNENGTNIQVIDEFAKRNLPQTVKYIISEIVVPATYRKIQDVVLEVTYNEDGRIGNYTVVSNPSKVKIEVALASSIKYTDDRPVHIALTIPNDNAYDLVIKNEDKNCEGLGIQGTTYSVGINGKDISPKTTNAQGIVEELSRTENGEIQIKIAENTIGEGYREDLSNDITFTLSKGEAVYSLKLNETKLAEKEYTFTKKEEAANGDKSYDIVVNSEKGTTVNITVNEITGIVTVTFKNETKLELTLTKNDINTGELLDGAEFEVTSQIISPTLGSPQTITKDDNKITDENGRLYFDLGVAPQNKVVKYTFKEINPPNRDDGTPYGKIKDVEVQVKFDMYGRIAPQKALSDNSQRCEVYMASQTGKSHDMRVIIGNGALKQAFTVKIISEDSETGERINNSTFKISAQEVSSHEVAMKEKIVKTSTVSGISGITMQEGMYVDKNVGTQNDGDIIINIAQQQAADGYVYGNNAIEGTVIVNKENLEGDDLEASVKLTLGEITGFDTQDVVLDTDNNEVIITVKNTPNVSIEIDKFYKEIGSSISKPLPDVTFQLQAEVEGVITKTIKDKVTDEHGKLKIDLGTPEYGKTVTYRLTEITKDGFEEFEELIFKVRFDSEGKILNYTIETNEEHAQIKEQRTISVPQEQVNEDGQKVVQGAQNYTITTTGSRTIPMSIENEKLPERPNYTIVLEKHSEMDEKKTTDETEEDEKPILIPGATYEITVTEENGIEYTWTQTTDKTGKIVSRDFNGYGKITVKITEIEAPTGYSLDGETKTLTFVRDEKSGKFTLTGSKEVDFEINEEQTEIHLKPVDKVAEFTINLYKIDAETTKRIEDNTTGVEVYMEAYDSIFKIGEGHMDENGALSLVGLEEPDEAGKYKLFIKEIQAPKGYLLPDDDFVIEVEFEKISTGELRVKNVTSENEFVSGIKTGEKYITLNIANEIDYDTPEKSYNIELQKHSAVPGDEALISGAKYLIKIQEKDGIQTVQETTNDEGKIITSKYHGNGKIRVELTEIEAPAGYLKEKETKWLEFRKDPDNGNLTYVDGNVNYAFSNDGKSTVILKPEDELANYAMYINKVDAKTNYRIQNNSASFEIYYYSPEDDAIIKVGEGDTDKTGQLRIDTLIVPNSEGEHTYYIKEVKEPTDYQIIDNDMELKIIVKQDEEGNYYLAGATTRDEHLKVTLVSKKYIKLKVSNEPPEGILKYNFILEKHTMIDGDNTLIPGATFNIKVTQQFGNSEEWVDTTNEDGVIVSNTFEGYGNIRVDIVELTAPYGFEIDGTEQFIEFSKDKETGLLRKIKGNVDFDFSEDERGTVYIKPRDEFAGDSFAIYFNKVNAKTMKTVQNNPTSFELYKENEQGEYILLKKFDTNDLGTARVMIPSPEKIGKIRYLLKEIKEPIGYEKIEDGTRFEIEYALNTDGKAYIKNIATIDPEIQSYKYDDQYCMFNVLNNKLKNETSYFDLEITKTDSATGKPINAEDETKTAIFKLIDENGKVRYAESDENGKVLFTMLEKPNEIPAGEEFAETIVTIKEIMSPTGYKLDRGEIQIKLKFAEDSEGHIILLEDSAEIEAGGHNAKNLRIEGETVKVDISNEKGSSEEGNIDRGKYSIILTKVEKDTEKLIPKEAEFNIGLENGQRIQSSVKDSATIEVLDIKAPAVAGTYEYVIQETKAPRSYVLVEQPQIFRITFEDSSTDPSQLVITNAEAVLDENEITYLDIKSFTNNTVKVNFINELDLYLKSKQDDIGENIYNVLQKEDVPYVSHSNKEAQKLGKTYTMNEPFIVTKEVLQKPTTGHLGITIEEFVNNLDTNAETITIYDEDGTEAAQIQMDGKGHVVSVQVLKSDVRAPLAKTKQKLVARKGDRELTYTIAIKGDLTGDGMITTADSTRIKQIIADSKSGLDIEKVAGDVETEGLITTADSTRIKIILAGDK